MTAKLLPFDRPAPQEPPLEQPVVTRDTTAGGGLSFTLTIGFRRWQP